MNSNEVAARLKRNPHPSSVKERNGQKYVSISNIEKLLDTLFTPFGWETKKFKYTIVVNEVVGSLVLRIKDPDTGKWISRTGAGAVMIQMKKDSNVLDVSSKIANAMEKMMPKLKADCIRNACKGLGKVFGRDLGRKDADVEKFSEMENQFLDTFKQITKGLTSIEEIQEKYRAVPEALRGMFEFKEVLRERVEFATAQRKELGK